MSRVPTQDLQDAIVLMRSRDGSRMGLRMAEPILFDDALAMCCYAIGILYEDAVLSMPEEERAKCDFDGFLQTVGFLARQSSNMRLAGAVDFEPFSTVAADA